MPAYYTIITDAGQALLAGAIASGQPVVLTQFAVGDGAGAAVIPDPAMTTLTSEVYRTGISAFSTSPEQPNAMVAQLIIPKESGGYTVREVALFTEDGTMFSIGNYPDQPKPPTDSGYAVRLDMRYLLVVSDTSAITVVIPPGDYLTHEEADTLYLAIGKNFSEIAGKGATAQQEARDNLGLKSAAMHDVTTSHYDVKAEHVLRVGDYAWGINDGSAKQLTDIFDIDCSGVYLARGVGSGDHTANMPPESGNIVFGVVALNLFPNEFWVQLVGHHEYYTGLVNKTNQAVTWVPHYTTENPPPVADLSNYFTKTESDARYLQKSTGITGIRMASYGDVGGDLRDSSQNVMTGIYETNGYDNPTHHEYRKLQYQLNDAWYNAPYV